MTDDLPTATPRPLPPKAVIAPPSGANYSSYTTTVLPDGWTRFHVVGARGKGVLWLLLPLGPLFGGMFGNAIGQTSSGVWMGSIFVLLLVAAHRAGWSRFDQHRAPAGKFDASVHGLRFANGKGLPVADIQRVLFHNSTDGVVFSIDGAVARSHFNAVVPIAFQVEVETGGRRIPLVGSMTEATARAVYNEVVQILRF